MPLYKAGRERGPRVSLSEARKSFHLWFYYSLPENTPLVASSTKNLASKSSPFPALKKQPNTLWMDLSSKLASNSKLTSDKHKKRLKNNLCLYCGTGDHKLNSCPKKQTMVSPKGHGASATADTPAATSEKPSEK